MSAYILAAIVFMPTAYTITGVNIEAIDKTLSYVLVFVAISAYFIMYGYGDKPHVCTGVVIIISTLMIAIIISALMIQIWYLLAH